MNKSPREFLLLKVKGAYNGQCFMKPYSIRDRDWSTGFKRKDHEIIDVIEQKAFAELRTHAEALALALKNCAYVDYGLDENKALADFRKDYPE